MARNRRVGKYVTFTPPTFLDGVAQVVDCWGNSSTHVDPPRLVYVKKTSARRSIASRFGNMRVGINAILSEDVNRVGEDFRVCVAKYVKQLPPEKRRLLQRAILHQGN